MTYRALHKAFWPPSLPHDQDRAEVRILAAVLTFFFVCHLVEPGVYAAGVQTSIFYKVVALTRHPELMLVLLFGCAALVVPHLISLLFLPRMLDCRLPRQMACAGACGAAMLWAYLGTLAVPLDADVLPFLYWLRGFVDLGVGFVFAFSLNSQQLREFIHEARAAG